MGQVSNLLHTNRGLTDADSFPRHGSVSRRRAALARFHSHLVHALNQLLAPGLMNRYVSRVLTLRRTARPFIEVRQAADDRLITVLEMVSPANKSGGTGRQVYLDQRQTWHAANASLVEIDLLLQGRPLLDYAREACPIGTMR